ncbi:MAG TPA: response regulator transcription factor [Anaerolineales bacterium]|nr:response regulator transcription factor [Anaerolineales bacterium]
MGKPKLLVVDDEADLIAELAPLLTRAGYQVVSAGDPLQALRRIEDEQPDLIILDVLMPGMDGREVLRRLRHSQNWIPIILLTRVGSPGERAHGLQEGADDYLNKPFDPMELIARIEAVLRRTRQGSMGLSGFPRLASGDLSLNRQTRQASLAGKVLPLTARAFGILERLMLQPTEVVGRERLLDEVWGWAYPVQTRAVDIRVAELRKFLQDDPAHPTFIETVVGQGYRFIGPVEGRL